VTRLYVFLAIALIFGALAYSCSRARDRYRICRGLGHGMLYCIFAEGE
jgi:hypothetical protein